jgi:glycosyltransferase involved in cell wall biosynthesis
MRVVVVVEAIPPYCGGGEQVAWIHAVEMAKIHEVSVLTFGDHKDSFVRDDVTVYTLPTVGRRLLYYGTIGRRVLNNILRSLRPDVVHHHMPNVLSACIGRGDWLTISTIHDGTPENELVQLGVTSRAQFIKFKAIRWLNVRKADVVTCVSRFSRDLMCSLYPKHRNKFVFIPNPIYERLFTPVASPDGDYVLNFGRQIDLKMGVLLEVARQMPSTVFYFVGTGPMVESVKLPNVHFYGFSEHVEEYIDDSAVCVFPSKSENFPLVGLEAMARGKAVIAARRGFGEYIVHGKNGYLLDSMDSATVMRAVQEVIDDASLRHRLAAAGRRTAERYRSGVIVSKYLRLYEEALRAGARHAVQACGE